MKKYIFPGVLLFVFIVSLSSLKSYDTNNSMVAEDEKVRIAKFLVEMYDARLMDMEEGKLAVERGTTQEIRQYGQLMVTDQATLKMWIERMAEAKGVALSTTLSNKKAKGLAGLKKHEGNKFDKKFLKMIKIDHQRDVKKFRKATEFEDKAMSAFAKEHLPMIEEHLRKIKEIK